MLTEYCEVAAQEKRFLEEDALYSSLFSPAVYLDPLNTLLGMGGRFPEDGDEAKAMRWLGFAQGVLYARKIFSLEDVKNHTRRKYVLAPPGSEETP